MKIKKPKVPIKYHGGDSYMVEDIISLFSPHLHYVETHFGGGSTLLAHPMVDRSELVNDINGDLMNFWRVLQSPTTFSEFSRYLQAVPLSRVEWEESAGRMNDPDPMIRAAAFFIRCRQSMSGRMESFTPPSRTRTRRQMNGNVSEWLGAVEMLPEVHMRLRRVFIENMKAEVLIPREDTVNTLFYVDPPFHPDTRSSPDIYAHEMTAKEHENLINILLKIEGMFVLSGYRCELYDDMLVKCQRTDVEMANNSASGYVKQRRTESLWTNFEAVS